MNLLIRPARPSDAAAVTAIHCSDIVVWKSWDSSGEVRWARYEDLTPEERWLNGGPWMDVSTCSRHLEHMGRGPRRAWVAELEGEVRAEAEAYLGEEPEPFGRHLDLAVLYTRRGFAGRGLGTALVEGLVQHARQTRCQSFCVSSAQAPGFYARMGLKRWQTWREVEVPLRGFEVRYLSERLEVHVEDAVAGWAMPIGRGGSSAQMWDQYHPDELPPFRSWESRCLEAVRLSLRGSGEQAYLVLDEKVNRRGCPVALVWTSPGNLSAGVWAAVRDRASSLGMRALQCLVDERKLGELGTGVRLGRSRREVWGMPLESGRESPHLGVPPA